VDGSDLGKLISYIRGFASKLEAEKIKERTLRGKGERAKEGTIPHGGFAPPLQTLLLTRKSLYVDCPVTWMYTVS